MSNIQHDNSISIIRVTAMMMIVLYHCLCYNAGIWTGFDNVITYRPIAVATIRNIAYVGLDAFVFISGLLYYRISTTGKYKNEKAFLRNKTERLLIPYIAWGILLCLIFWNYENPIRILYGISHLWFLLMLFEIFAIVSLTKAYWNKLNLEMSLCILVTLLVTDGLTAKLAILPHDDDGRVLLAMQSTIDYLPIFYLGIITEKFDICNKVKIKRNIALIIVLLLFSIGIVPFLIHMHITRLYQWLPTYLLLVIVYSTLKKGNRAYVGGGKRQTVILLIDNFSLAIYIIHHILIFIYFDYVPGGQSFMSEHFIIAPILMFIVALPLSLLITYGLSYMPCSKYIIGISANRSISNHSS